jgi:hypothetical protein
MVFMNWKHSATFGSCRAAFWYVFTARWYLTMQLELKKGNTLLATVPGAGILSEVEQHPFEFPV